MGNSLWREGFLLSSVFPGLLSGPCNAGRNTWPQPQRWQHDTAWIFDHKFVIYFCKIHICVFPRQFYDQLWFLNRTGPASRARSVRCAGASLGGRSWQKMPRLAAFPEVITLSRKHLCLRQGSPQGLSETNAEMLNGSTRCDSSECRQRATDVGHQGHSRLMLSHSTGRALCFLSLAPTWNSLKLKECDD